MNPKKRKKAVLKKLTEQINEILNQQQPVSYISPWQDKFINFIFHLYDVKITSFRFRPNNKSSVEIFLKTLGRIQIF